MPDFEFRDGRRYDAGDSNEPDWPARGRPEDGASMSDPLERMLNEQVVLDTATPVVYIGLLVEVTQDVFVLAEADMHDCSEGHSKKERYLAETSRSDVSINRHQVVVMRSAVISVSRLADVVAD